MDLINLADLINGGSDDEHVMCPTCVGTGHVETSSYGPCDRCGRAGYIPMDQLTEREQLALLDAYDEPSALWEGLDDPEEEPDIVAPDQDDD